MSSSGTGRIISLVIYHRNGAQIVAMPFGKSVVVGRTPPVDILVQDSTLSRRHARFEAMEDHILVEDMNSSNGVWLGDRRIRREELRPGHEVYMGRIVVSIQLLSAEEIPMHQVISHDQLVGVLEQEVSKAQMDGSSLSVLHVEADNKAAKVSQWFGALCKVLRPGDNMALYSDTAVVILLPGTTHREAKHLAMLFQESSEREVSPDPALRIGVSAFPDSAITADELLQSSRGAFGRATDQDRVRLAPPQRFRRLQPRVPSPKAAGTEPVVSSPAMKKVFDAVDRLANSDIPVLLLGETGTGKEVVARAIHERGTRRDRELCCINCASIPVSLVESTLFGHVRGAFTGADKDARGVFEEAEGGTLLLDEIGELPQSIQANLLRVLETKQVGRVGSAKTRTVDVRIIASTHRDLEQMNEAGQFRQDLYYRINTMTLRLPPLRERPEEIGELVDHFIGQMMRQDDSGVRSIEADALRLLERYSWPGNVRQLRNVIERAAVLAQGESITMEDLPERVRLHRADGDEPSGIKPIDTDSLSVPPAAPDRSAPQDFKTQVQELEVRLIREALEQAGGNQTEAAKQLRMPRRTLVRKIKQYGL
jgi:DNA-binding NtrC family response regulator